MIYETAEGYVFKSWLQHIAEVTEKEKHHSADDGSGNDWNCLLYTSPSPRDATLSRMPSSA